MRSYGWVARETVSEYPSEQAFRRQVIRERGHDPHPFTPSHEKKHGLVVCSVCGMYRPYFAHDEDLRQG